MRRSIALPLRDKHGDLALIMACNGEVVVPELMRESDRPRAIITVFGQQFFDIGAAIPDFRCVPA